MELDSIAINGELFDLIPGNITRSMFVLYFKWGLDVEEIAEAFGVDQDLVDKQLEQAKKEIKKAYER